MCCNNIVISFWVLILTRDDTSCLTLLSCVKLICSNEFFFFFFFDHQFLKDLMDCLDFSHAGRHLWKKPFTLKRCTRLVYPRYT